MFTAIVRFIYNIVGEYGITIFLCVALSELIVMPLSILQKKVSKAKLDVTPRVNAIYKKYNANAMGIGDDVDGLSPEIQAMTKDERDKNMADEIGALYKELGYRPWIGVAYLIAIMLVAWFLYGGITGACPEGSIYALRLNDIKESIGEHILPFILLVSPVFIPIVNGGISLWNSLADKKENENPKVLVITTAMSSALSVVISVFVVLRVSVALSFTIGLFGLFSTIVNAIIMGRRNEKDA